mgnify:FL=1
MDRETDGVFAVCPVASVSRFVFFRPPIGSFGERAEATGAERPDGSVGCGPVPGKVVGFNGGRSGDLAGRTR